MLLYQMMHGTLGNNTMDYYVFANMNRNEFATQQSMNNTFF